MRTIPGFAAEASLYKGREHYYAAQGRPAGAGVRPAQLDMGIPLIPDVPDIRFPPRCFRICRCDEFACRRVCRWYCI